MTVLPRDHEWTVDDLALLPDDGLQYQLVDGVLLVSPAPSMKHQRVQRRLGFLLGPLVPDHLELFFAPVDYQPTKRRSLQPDLLIISKEDGGEAAATLPLVLAVEIVSPSSRSIDLVLKRELYEQSRVLHYWVADPESRRLLAWSLTDGRYGEPLLCEDYRPLSVTAPFDVTLSTEAIFG